MENLLLAFLFTTIAGLSTGIGAAFAFVTREVNLRFLSFCTGLSAGVMLYVAFMEILPHGISEVERHGMGASLANFLGTIAFFGGIAFIFAIDRLVPDETNPHEPHPAEAYEPLHHADKVQGGSQLSQQKARHLLRTGLFTALAITIHNFPEGLATFLTALEDPSIGVAVTIAIALHNIPEGISVSIPIYYATGSRWRAFFYACMSGFAEPIGALLLWGTLALVYQQVVFTPPALLIGLVSAGVAGIMVFISLDELLPTSRAYGKGHDSIYGVVLGMILMAASLLVL